MVEENQEESEIAFRNYRRKTSALALGGVAAMALYNGLEHLFSYSAIKAHMIARSFPLGEAIPENFEVFYRSATNAALEIANGEPFKGLVSFLLAGAMAVGAYQLSKKKG